ncbi:MAG TPA: hypothetical protein VLA34_01205 [Candidatus Krumholzibacterium sp.]|nr:hypothetical protein [Candidatus Krumholzibacterium sp.]
MRRVLIVMLPVILMISSFPDAQIPPSGEECIDIRADSIAFSYPHPDSIRVEAFYTILSATPAETYYDCDIGVFLDGIPVDLSGMEIGWPFDDCFGKEEADCEGDCTVTIDGNTASGTCVFWKDPWDTIFATCVCSAGIRRIWGLSYAGEDILSFELDIGNTIPERDETNNSWAVPIGAIGTENSSWGRIKTRKSGQD